MSVYIYLIGFYKMAIILTTNTMGLLTMLCVGCLTIYSAATQCQGNQHCSECDNITGHCMSDCDPGYYDQKCMSVCSDNCRHNTCIMSNTGNDYCTDGCVPGYQGPECGKPCYNPGGNCTACPGECDGGYCQLGSSCVSGCVESYYGTGCQNCSSGCMTCNRKTGTCDEKPATQCHDIQHCSECDNITGHCITGCEVGYYDQKCMSVCSDNCRNNTCISSNTGNGNCTEGCVPGYQGPGCGKPCYSPGGNCTACPGGCDGGYCQLGSSCYSGCEDSYYGTGCKNCSSGCTPCNRTTGSCDDKPGRYEVR
ncbi:multiple epidermal growth factor-like domains protein 11 [Haliotis rufescens]|uniref:multiple epidermal growth factor-like domains protein 11 n=1 Tax=Haliotis rufescens TaxID=6454 RepID=UPI00201F7150|nr:multiple epidermal growth factor-like domains protein 11 [Haliotis rufescens]